MAVLFSIEKNIGMHVNVVSSLCVSDTTADSQPGKRHAVMLIFLSVAGKTSLTYHCKKGNRIHWRKMTSLTYHCKKENRIFWRKTEVSDRSSCLPMYLVKDFMHGFEIICVG